MKYNYDIKIIERNGNSHFAFCLPEGFEPITRLINTDVGDEYIARIYIDACEKVLNGETVTKTISGNTCIATFNQDFTYVEDLFIDKKTICIETSELLLLIEAFLKEKNQYLNSKKY